MADLLTGADSDCSFEECWGCEEYNINKNHWYGATAPTAPVNGLLWVKNDGTTWIYFDGEWTILYNSFSRHAFQNLISNSGFGVGSRSVLTDIVAQINVTDITNGVCTTGDTQDLQVGDLVKFNGGGSTGTNVYEVIALVVDTTFTIHDTTITDPANVNCDEATPAFIVADDYAPDTWTKTTTLDLYRWFNHTAFHKGMYGLQVWKGINGAEYLNAFGQIFDLDHHYLRFRGREVTFGCWIYSVTASDNVKIQINDSDGTEESTSHCPANVLTWMEVTRTIGATITSFTPRILFDGDTADVAYVSRPMLIFGSSIGEGNYQPIQQEVIYPDLVISSIALASKTFSTTGWTALNLEADTDGRLPKGIKLVQLYVSIGDSGSLGVASNLRFRGNVIMGETNRVSCWGLPNDFDAYTPLIQPCNPSGDIEYRIQASGANTLDVGYCRYSAIQVN